MERFLARVGLSRHLRTFVDEEMTPELLLSMAEGNGWSEAMGELGVDTSDAATLRRALTAPDTATATPAPTSSTSTGAPAVASSISASQTALAMSADLAAALATVAATRAPSDEPAQQEGFNVTHINHVNPETTPASAALAAYQRRQMQQNVQQQQQRQQQSTSGAATRPNPHARYSPAPPAPPSVRPIGRFSQGGVVPVPSAASRPDVFGAPPSAEATVTDEHDLD